VAEGSIISRFRERSEDRFGSFASVAGVSRTRLFEAIRDHQLTVRKAGRSTLVFPQDLRDWLNSLPVRGKQATRSEVAS
jgi:hypothetical protein